MSSQFLSKLKLITVLRIDIYLFLFMLGYYISQVPTTQLIEDKICYNEMNLDDQVCSKLENSGEDDVADAILERTTSIKNWQTILSTIPGVVISLFTGFWIDSYPTHIRYLLALPCFAVFLQSVTLIYQCVHFETALSATYWSFFIMGIGGSIPLVLTCSFTYVARKTSQKYRSIRFAVVELFLLTAQPAATALGAEILAAKPWFAVEKRNYIGVFLTNAVIMLIATFWVIWLLNDCDSGIPAERRVSKGNVLPTKGSLKIPNYRSTDTDDQNMSIPSNDSKRCQGVTNIINIANVVTTFKTCFRRRENNGRAKVIHICLAIFVFFISLLSETFFGFQFTEKAFHWDYKYYSAVNSALLLIQAFGALVGAAFFKSLFNLGDASLTVIAALSHLLSNIFKGIGNQEAYVFGYVVYGLGGMSIPSARSTLTQLIEFQEIAQIYTLLSCLQAASPMVSSIFCTSIFKATLETMPGATYHAVAVILFYPLIVFLWINLSQTQEKTQEKTQESSQNQLVSTYKTDESAVLDQNSQIGLRDEFGSSYSSEKF